MDEPSDHEMFRIIRRKILAETDESCPLPSRFRTEFDPDHTAVGIVDTETGRRSEVSLMVYQGARQVLFDLFGEK